MNGNWTPAEEALHATDPARRAAVITAFTNAAVFYETHPNAPLPDRFVFSIDVPGDGPDERWNACLMAAIELGVHAQDDGGCLCAARLFGPVTLEARTPARKAAKAA